MNDPVEKKKMSDDKKEHVGLTANQNSLMKVWLDPAFIHKCYLIGDRPLLGLIF